MKYVKIKIMKYVKRPILVDAWQIDTLEIEHQGNYPDWVHEAAKARKIRMNVSYPIPTKRQLAIRTLEGDMTAEDGDYLIKGPKGEFWFNKREIFEEMYEAIND